jgi:N-carbamoyl-L-amino-acid hydrolase
MSTRNDLRIDRERLWATLMETAQFGATAAGGICRLALTDEDRAVRDWFRAAAEAAGCTVEIDEMGNMFARRPGRDPNRPPIAIGSHLDTQPTGGKFDGVLGVLAGLEVIRTLNDHGIETDAPIEVINWTNEEGSRFAPAMLASGVFAGVFDRDYAYARIDRDDVTFGEALEKIGYRGSARAGDHPLAAHFELHIEQGPVLEAENVAIGVVTGVQAIRWYDVTVTGQENHAGATPMALRRDALAAAAAVIGAVEEVAREMGGVGTVGVIESHPQSRNVIPGRVFLSIDLRHPEDSRLAAMEARLGEKIAALAEARHVEIAFERIWHSPAVAFDPACIKAVADSATHLGYTHREIVSGPGHDSVYVSRVAPTAMIFIPCAGGLSHNERESITPEQAEAGANVLLHALLATEARLSRQR